MAKKYSDDKALLLENGCERDIPERFLRYLRHKKIEWEYFHTGQAFVPINREKTFKFFSALPVGKLIVCATVFDGYSQLERMILMFHALKEKNFTLMVENACFAEDVAKWYDKYEADIIPRTEEYDDDTNKRKALKKDLNKKFTEVLKSHDIRWVTNLRKLDGDIKLTSIGQIKRLAK